MASVTVEIKRNTYEDLVRMADSLKEYNSTSFNDFVDQILKSGMLLVETAHKHRDK